MGTLAGAVLRGDQAPPAPFSLTVPMTSGTAVISGVVIESSSRRPIANAVVALGPPTRGPVGQPPRQLTDARGRFVFRDLPASDAYYVNTSKFGYFDGQFGHSAPALGSRVGVTDGQLLNITIEMEPGAAHSRRRSA